ncbi:MAG: diacylglycerol kinase family lipid kinase [Cyclobacteriaceae bacterium]|jgi:YegS/Rv2252/BmrU family lipid kinase|nr:diacylglycerol kinase family lipid kinase [Cyclobacteriaceae bacterium]
MPRHNILIIANRRSGTGSAADLETLATRVLRDADVTFTFTYTRAPGHATELARDGIRDGFTAVVAAGGDGTINEVARAVVGSSTPLGIIPRGSGNGLARHLGIPLDPEKALACVVEATPTPIDTFTLNERLSLNVSGIGFDAHVADVFNQSKRRGLMNYVRIATQEYRRFVPFNVQIDGTSTQAKLHRVFFIAIANSSQYGNNARIAPAASVRDGKLNINAVKRIPLYRLDTVWSLFRGDVTKKSWCTTFETRDATFRTDRKVAYHVDGEPCGTDDTFVVRVRAKSLRVIVPKGAV